MLDSTIKSNEKSVVSSLEGKGDSALEILGKCKRAHNDLFTMCKLEGCLEQLTLKERQAVKKYLESS